MSRARLLCVFVLIKSVQNQVRGRGVAVAAAEPDVRTFAMQPDGSGPSTISTDLVGLAERLLQEGVCPRFAFHAFQAFHLASP